MLAIAACAFLFWRNGVNAEARAVAEASLKTVVADNAALTTSLTDAQARHEKELKQRDDELVKQRKAASDALAIAQAADQRSVTWRTKFDELTRNPDECWNQPLPDRLFVPDGVREDGGH